MTKQIRDSEKFERLTAEIFNALRNNPRYESVDHDVMLPGKDGPRQIDIVLRGKVGPVESLVIIECKDYNKNVSVEAVDKLHSVIQDVNAQQGILVSSKGFSKTAIQKAKRLGIQLFTAHKANTEKWDIKLQLPIIIEEIVPTLTPSYITHINADQAKAMDYKVEMNAGLCMRINDCDLGAKFKEYWDREKDGIWDKGDEFEWVPPGLTEPYHICDMHGNKIQVKELKINVTIGKIYYFGYINEMENSKVLQSITNEKVNVICDLAKIFDYKNHFKVYQNYSDLPRLDVMTLKWTAVPQVEFLESPTLQIKMKEVPV